MSDTWQWKWSQAKLRATSTAHPSAIAGYTELVRVGGNALGAAAALPCGPRATVGPQIGSPSEFATSAQRCGGARRPAAGGVTCGALVLCARLLLRPFGSLHLVTPFSESRNRAKKNAKISCTPSGQPVTVSFQVKTPLFFPPSLFRALCVWSRPASLCEACSERGQAEGSLVSIGASSQLMRALAQSLWQKAQCSCAITVAKGPVFGSPLSQAQ